MIKLKPCPFCGRTMKVDYEFNPLRFAIVHVSKFYWDDMCYGGTDYVYSTAEEAVKDWNMRYK